MRLRRGCLEGEAWEALSRFCRLWRRESGCSVQALERLYRGGRLWKAREALEKRSGEVLWRGSEGSIIFLIKKSRSILILLWELPPNFWPCVFSGLVVIIFKLASIY